MRWMNISERVGRAEMRSRRRAGHECTSERRADGAGSIRRGFGSECSSQEECCFFEREGKGRKERKRGKERRREENSNKLGSVHITRSRPRSLTALTSNRKAPAPLRPLSLLFFSNLLAAAPPRAVPALGSINRLALLTFDGSCVVRRFFRADLGSGQRGKGRRRGNSPASRQPARRSLCLAVSQTLAGEGDEL